jgi:mRNA-degrading endonuclease RelE of RelBE toxin-antitoxin system
VEPTHSKPANEWGTRQEDPFQGDIKRLKGQPTAWRRRVGNYRIIYDLYFEKRLIVVSSILRRTSTTY